jgi:hypothetical protein
MLPLVDGSWALLVRNEGLATLLTADPDDGRLVHPFLATTAVIFSWWHGRHAFHGGAFADAEGRAWALLGERGTGKSTTLALLAEAGMPIVADDLLVVDAGRVYAGPRVLDLRPDAALRLGRASEAQLVRQGERRRLGLGAAPPEPPLAGWIFLRWGQGTAVRRLGPLEWLERATAHLNTVTVDSPSLLGLAGAEAWEVTRPRTLDSLEATAHELRALVGG